MRLTIINQFYRPDVSPTAVLAASLAEHRARMGDEVTVIAGKGGYTGGAGPSAESRPGANPRVRRVWTPGLGKANNLKRVIDYGAFYAFAAWKLATLPRQDLIISLTTPPLIAWAGLLHKRIHPRTKLVLWNMDCYPDLAERSGVIATDGLVARIARGRNRAIFRALDHLITLDTATAQLLCRQYAHCQPGLPVTVIPNWEEATFFPREAEHAPWPGRRGLGLEGRTVVLYLGNMGYGHAFDTVIEAAEALRDEPVTFLFVGGGKREAEVAAAVKARGLTNVILHGYVPKEQTASLMTAADCALVTLRDEILGIMSPSKIHSNLAMGLPLIYVGPERSNVDEAVKRFGCGVSLRHGQSAELAAFVRGMRADPAERARLRRAAREAFDAAYCDTATHPLFDAVIEHAMGGRGARAEVPSGVAADYAGPTPAPAPERAAAPVPAMEGSTP